MAKEYKVGVAISHGKKLISFCMLTKETAEVLYSILDQEPSRCFEAVKALLRVMSESRVKGVKPDTISVSRRTPGATIESHETVEIPWQAGMMLGVAMALQNELGVYNLKKDLEKIIMGTAENRSVLRPYFAAEGYRV